MATGATLQQPEQGQARSARPRRPDSGRKRPPTTPRPSLWARALHFSYAISSRTNYFFHRRIRPQGIAVGVLIVLSTLCATGSYSRSVDLLLAIAISTSGVTR